MAHGRAALAFVFVFVFLSSLATAATERFMCTASGLTFQYLDKDVQIQPAFQAFREDGTNVDVGSGGLAPGEVCDDETVEIRPAFTESEWRNLYDQLPILRPIWNTLPTPASGPASTHPIGWATILPSTTDTTCLYSSGAPAQFSEGHISKTEGVQYAQYYSPSAPDDPPVDTCVSYGGAPDNVRCRAGDALINLPCQGTLQIRDSSTILHSYTLQGDTPLLAPYDASFATDGAHSVNLRIAGLACVSHFRSIDNRAFVYSGQSAIDVDYSTSTKTITAVPCGPAPTCTLSVADSSMVCPATFQVRMNYQNVPAGSRGQIVCTGTSSPPQQNVDGNGVATFSCSYSPPPGSKGPISGQLNLADGSSIPCTNSVTVTCEAAPPVAVECIDYI